MEHGERKPILGVEAQNSANASSVDLKQGLAAILQQPKARVRHVMCRKHRVRKLPEVRAVGTLGAGCCGWHDAVRCGAARQRLGATGGGQYDTMIHRRRPGADIPRFRREAAESKLA